MVLVAMPAVTWCHEADTVTTADHLHSLTDSEVSLKYRV